jgi:hypothetical protein
MYICDNFKRCYSESLDTRREPSAKKTALVVVLWSARLPFKLGDSGSILARTSTQGLKIIEEKVLPLH